MFDIADLRVSFPAAGGETHAVNGLSLSIEAGQIVAVVGESGSGKTVTALSVLRLLRASRAKSTGAVFFQGRDLMMLGEAELRRIRGNRIAMVPQNPMSSLNPVMTVGAQIAESIRLHQPADRAQAWRRAVDLLSLVGIGGTERRALDYPHRLSGGMRQRAMIAMALACKPDLLIADEPTTALDVTVQARILDLIAEMRGRFGTAVMLISHDLGVVSDIADRVVILYGGRKMEEGPVRRIFDAPRHPYTRALLAAMPRLGAAVGPGRTRLAEIPAGSPADAGCPFAPRCPLATGICAALVPSEWTLADSHRVACHHAEGKVAP